MLNKSASNIVNALLFQATWFACVIGGAHSILWPALLSCGALMFWQLSPKRRHPSDVLLVIVAIVLGSVIDSLWIQGGFLSYQHQWPLKNTAPAWIIILWAAFALTINHSLNWLKLNPLLPALAGLIGAPLSYVAGEKLGAIKYQSDGLFVCSSIGIVWALVVSLMFLVSIQSSYKNKLLKRNHD